jgi:hypothetical protein
MRARLLIARGHAKGMHMRSATIGTAFRIFSYVVLLLMVTAIGYAAFITLKYWSGISV